MARNPFEQLQDAVLEPRQAFEEIVTLILKCHDPRSRRVLVYRGDGGIDAFTGNLGGDGDADVFQVKYFPAPWGDSQKRQIRESYQTARSSKDYSLNKWVLCVPTRLRKEDLRWFDEWRQEQDREIGLMDGDDLTLSMAHETCAPARSKLKEWGIVGLQSIGPKLTATAFIQREPFEIGGLLARLYLRIENDGDQSARAVKATITHAETGCVANQEHEDWERSPNDGRINPRVLRYKHVLHPGDQSVVMGIPLCERSAMPFTVSIRFTAEDCRPTELFCYITAEQLAAGQPVPFKAGALVSSSATAPSEAPKLHPPTLEIAKELLQMMLAHPVPEQRGLTEILGASPAGILEVCFIPNTTASGNAPSVKKSLLLPAITELCQLGWLLSPESDDRIRVYELNPKAAEMVDLSLQ